MCFPGIDGYSHGMGYVRHREKDLFEEVADKICKFAVGALVGAAIFLNPAVLPLFAIGATTGTLIAAMTALVIIPIVMTGAIIAGTMAITTTAVTLAAAPILLPFYAFKEILN